MSRLPQSIKEDLLRIKQWIEENQHKYKKGITFSTYFSGVVKIPGTDEFFPPNINQSHPLYVRYCGRINGLRKAGYLERKRLTPNGCYNWVVNESRLADDKTGVSHTIPYTPPAPEPPKSKPAEDIEKAATEFIMNELKTIKVRHVLLATTGRASINLSDVTLYDVYKLGLSLEQTLGTEYVKPEHKEIEQQLETQVEEDEIENNIENNTENNIENNTEHNTIQCGDPFNE